MIKATPSDNDCLIEPQGPLTHDDFSTIANCIDPIIERNGRMDGLIIKTRRFPGWESLADIIDHLRFVRDHHRAIDRVALVTDTALAQVFPVIARHFVGADVRQFDFDDYHKAVNWISAQEEA